MKDKNISVRNKIHFFPSRGDDVRILENIEINSKRQAVGVVILDLRTNIDIPDLQL